MSQFQCPRCHRYLDLPLGQEEAPRYVCPACGSDVGLGAPSGPSDEPLQSGRGRRDWWMRIIVPCGLLFALAYCVLVFYGLTQLRNLFRSYDYPNR
jgi:hypothetical protein